MAAGDGYHAVLAAAGLGVLAAFWIPRFLSGRDPATSFLLLAFGALFFAVAPWLPPAPDPVTRPAAWLSATELCVVFALFGTGLRIDRAAVWSRSLPTVRLLAIGMPLTIGLVALAGWWLAGLSLAASLLLGGMLAPTDPVLAGGLQVGPPMEGGENPLRYTLTTEAGLNDGLAFPFIHLAIAAGLAGAITPGLLAGWLVQDVIWRCLLGVAAGAGVGWLLGKILFDWPAGNALSDTGSGVLALAGVLPAFGLAEIAGGYGFVAAFIAGYTLRRSEVHHRFHRSLHDFCEAIEEATTAAILFALGAAMPGLLAHLDGAMALTCLALVLVIRPVVGWIALAGTRMPRRERLVVAFYGVRGIGSLYYVAYAGSVLAWADEERLWAAAAFTVLVSTLLHGLTAGFAVERATAA